MVCVLYHEGPCFVVNKPAGLLTQAPVGIDSLETRVKDYLRSLEGKHRDENIYLGLPHRLDRPVSGAILFARHVRAARRLSSQFENRTIGKVYWAVVQGQVSDDEGTWRDILHKRHGMPCAEVVAEDHPAGKHAVLHYRVLWRGVDATWLEIELETGRTHQIRVQGASRGYPVIGDVQYGSNLLLGPAMADPRDQPIALHAREIGFRHPMTDAPVTVTAPLPPLWQTLNIPQ